MSVAQQCHLWKRRPQTQGPLCSHDFSLCFRRVASNRGSFHLYVKTRSLRVYVSDTGISTRFGHPECHPVTYVKGSLSISSSCTCHVYIKRYKKIHMQLVILLANNFSWQIIAKCRALPGITSVIRKRLFFANKEFIHVRLAIRKKQKLL